MGIRKGIGVEGRDRDMEVGSNVVPEPYSVQHRRLPKYFLFIILLEILTGSAPNPRILFAPPLRPPSSMRSPQD